MMVTVAKLASAHMGGQGLVEYTRTRERERPFRSLQLRLQLRDSSVRLLSLSSSHANVAPGIRWCDR